MGRKAKDILSKILKKNAKKEVNSITIKLNGDAKFIEDMKYIIDNSKRVFNLNNETVISDYVVPSIKKVTEQLANEMREFSAKADTNVAKTNESSEE